MLTKSELQRLRSLREKKVREELGLFVIEGEKVVAELLAEGFPVAELYLTPAGQQSLHAAILPPPGNRPIPPAREVTVEEMARASHYPSPSGVLAVGRLLRTPLAPGALDRGLTLALDNVQDPGNVGTLLRVADWFGLDRVVLSLDCADLFHQKVINASMGSFARVRVHTADLVQALAVTRAPVLGCDLVGESIHNLPARQDAVIVIGSEGSGLTEPVKQRITQFVTIPRFGGAESLNAATAAAIVCDNLRRLLNR